MKTMRIGRDPENEIYVDNPHVSRHHANLQIDPQGNCVLVDQNSTNGSFVNNQRITRQELNLGDRVVLGSDYELPWMKYLPTIPAGRRTEAIDHRKTVTFEQQRQTISRPNPRPNPVPAQDTEFSQNHVVEEYNVNEKLETATNVIVGGIVLQVLLYVLALFIYSSSFSNPALAFVLIMMFLTGGVGAIILTQLKNNAYGAKGWVIAGLVVNVLTFPTSLVFLIGNIKALRVIRILNNPALAVEKPSYNWVWMVIGVIIIVIFRVISRM